MRIKISKQSSTEQVSFVYKIESPDDASTRFFTKNDNPCFPLDRLDKKKTIIDIRKQNRRKKLKTTTSQTQKMSKIREV